MRLSIWQQFSSNHSADFQLVGVFKANEDAQKVAAQMRHIIDSIVSWLPPHWNKWGVEYTQPELELMQEFNIPIEEWATHAISGEPMPLDWVMQRIKQNWKYGHLESVQVYENIVSLDPIYESWCSSAPFDILIERGGGQVYYSSEMNGLMLQCDVICILPEDTLSAEKLCEQLKIAFDYAWYLNPPWYYPDFPHIPPAPTVLALLQPEKRDMRASLEFIRSLVDKQARFNHVVDKLFALENYGYKVLKKRHEFTNLRSLSPLLEKMCDHELKLDFCSMSYEDQQLHIQLLWDKAHYNLAPLVAYLNEYGCTNIEINFQNAIA